MEGWSKLGDSCFNYFSNTTPLVWVDARDACENVTGTPTTPYLAVPNDSEELELIHSYAPSQAFWVGVTKFESDGVFIDINTGNEMLFNGLPITDDIFPWVYNFYPLSSPGLDCLGFSEVINAQGSTFGFMNDFCNSTDVRFHYVCEYNL